MHPVVHGLMTEGGAGLCYLRLVVGEDEIESAAMDIELLTEVFGTHRRALHMPSGEAFAPRTGPVHDMLGCRFLPEGEVVRVFLLVLSVQFTGLGDDVVEVTPGEFAVRIVPGIFLHVHIDRTIGDICVAAVEDLLHKSDLLDDVTRGVGFDGRRQYVQRRHVTMVTVGVILHDLHRLGAFLAILSSPASASFSRCPTSVILRT